MLEGILRARPEAILSVDTYKAATARAALEAGAEIVNDVSGFQWDAEMASVCAEFGCGVVLMHTRGRPEQWRAQPQLDSDALLAMVREGLAESLAMAERRRNCRKKQSCSIRDLDSASVSDENYALLARQAELLQLGRPLLAGVSRKSFLTHTLEGQYGGDVPMEARETGKPCGHDGGHPECERLDCESASSVKAAVEGGANCRCNSGGKVRKDASNAMDDGTRTAQPGPGAAQAAGAPPARGSATQAAADFGAGACGAIDARPRAGADCVEIRVDGGVAVRVFSRRCAGDGGGPGATAHPPGS